MKKSIKLFLCLALSVILIGCSTNGTNKITSKKAFDQFVDTLPAQLVDADDAAINTLFTNPKKAGFKEEIAQWTVPSYAKYQKDMKQSKRLNQKLHEFDYDSLSMNQQLTYDVLADQFADYDLNDKAAFYLANNPLGYYQGSVSESLLTFIQYHLNNKNDIDSYINLLNTSHDYFNDLFKFEKERQKVGYGLTQNEIKKEKQAIDEIVVADLSSLSTSFNQKIDQVTFVDDEAKTTYKQQVAELVETKFRKGLKDLATNLGNLKAKDYGNGSLANYKYGKDYFAYLVYQYTGFDNMSDYKKWLDEKFSVDDDNYDGEVFNEYVAAYQSYEKSTKSTTLTLNANDPNSVIAFLKKKMKADFPLAKDVKYNMETLPSGLRSLFAGTAAFYLISPVDNNNEVEQMMLVSNYHQKDYSIIAHEGYPGHMYSHVYYKGVKHPVVRDILSNMGSSEGYANYVQRYVSKYADNKATAEYLEAQDSLTLFAILQADYQLNYVGNEKKAMEIYQKLFMPNGTKKEIKETLSEVALRPATFVPYYGGGYRLSDLALAMEDKFDEKYTDYKFHKAVLEVGDTSYAVKKKWVAKFMKADNN